MGGKGGGGKSTLMTSLVDFFHAENCPVTLIDCDTENKVHGSFSHFFKEALKVDITTPSGFDEFVEKVLCDNSPIVLADLGAGSGKFTFKWFDDMHDPLQEAGVRFLAIGVLTSWQKPADKPANETMAVIAVAATPSGCEWDDRTKGKVFR